MRPGRPGAPELREAGGALAPTKWSCHAWGWPWPPPGPWPPPAAGSLSCSGDRQVWEAALTRADPQSAGAQATWAEVRPGLEGRGQPAGRRREPTADPGQFGQERLPLPRGPREGGPGGPVEGSGALKERPQVVWAPVPRARELGSRACGRAVVSCQPVRWLPLLGGERHLRPGRTLLFPF